MYYFALIFFISDFFLMPKRFYFCRVTVARLLDTFQKHTDLAQMITVVSRFYTSSGNLSPHYSLDQRIECYRMYCV